MTKKSDYRAALGDVRISEDCIRDVADVLRDGQLTEGFWTERVEKDWARFIGVREAIAVPNGTAGLHLCYLSSPGPVAVPALTFPATYNPARLMGKPVNTVEVEGLFMRNLDPSSLTQVPVHLMGIPHPKIAAFTEECDRRDWTLIEDACEAAGAEINGQKVGSFGKFGVFSFYVSHNISAGEYGIITTNDQYEAHVLRSLKNHGRRLDAPRGYFAHPLAGLNYKVTEVNSCIAWHQMRFCDDIRRRRLEIARRYQREVTNPAIGSFRISDGSSLLGMPFEAREDAGVRDEIMAWLFGASIECRAMFPARTLPSGEDFPNARRLSDRGFYVPVQQNLDDETVTFIIGRLNDFGRPAA